MSKFSLADTTTFSTTTTGLFQLLLGGFASDKQKAVKGEIVQRPVNFQQRFARTTGISLSKHACSYMIELLCYAHQKTMS